MCRLIETDNLQHSVDDDKQQRDKDAQGDGACIDVEVGTLAQQSQQDGYGNGYQENEPRHEHTDVLRDAIPEMMALMAARFGIEHALLLP